MTRQTVIEDQVHTHGQAPPPLAVPALALLRSAVRNIDARVRRADGIVEFCDDPDCILRIAPRRCACPVRLSDVSIAPGAMVVDLHLLNDHLLKDDGHGLVWGARFRHRLVASLRGLACALEGAPKLRDVEAIRARLASPLSRRRAELARFAARFGFEPAADAPAPARAHDLAENLWLVALGFAFGTQAHEHRSLLRWRGDVWISRARLRDRFGPCAPSGPAVD